MTPDEQYQQAYWWVHGLAGDPQSAVMDWRALHPTDKGDPGHAHRGTLPDCWQWLQQWNAAGWGIFAVVNELDGAGRKLENVRSIRAHVVDLDNAAADANYAAAAASNPHPLMAVHSSPGKHHTYWAVEPYAGVDRYQTMQRRLRQVYDSDPAVIDATRVMRVPGFINTKPGVGTWVTMEPLSGWSIRHPITTLEAAYQHVQVIEGGNGGRHELGDPELAAPSMEWVVRALAEIDPNTLGRDTWIATLAAAKQAAWTHGTPEQVEAMLYEWCGRYHRNDPAENIKQIASLRKTELGWNSLLFRAPALKAMLAFGAVQQPAPALVTAHTPAAVPQPPAMDCSGEILTADEQKIWFKGCVSITSLKKVMAPDGRFHDQTSFNMAYGGKLFIITSASGKTTDEAWKAVHRSTLWKLPQVDHTRFMPEEPEGAIVTDVLGRKGVNTYIKPNIVMQEGDVSAFTAWLAAVIPDTGDQRILLDWMAHTIKFPGFKIPWAPVIQSAEGIGKGIIKELMTYAIGEPYVHFPNADQLGESGGKFNGWMRNKVFILADEIKVGDKVHMVEILKPLISERLIEVQSKGVDQAMEDNCANWGFFTNYKDAIPINKNGRRYAIFYSPIQTADDVIAAGLSDEYFKAMFRWIHGGGAACVTHWLMNRPIERGDIPMRAPKTTSHDEAVKIGRSPIERVIAEAVAGQVPGFRGGWISLIAAMKRIRDEGAVRGNVPPHVVTGIMEGMGYMTSGQAPRAFMQDDPLKLADLYHLGGMGDVQQFGRMQGWE